MSAGQAHEITKMILSWDKKDVEDLIDLLQKLDEACGDDMSPDQFIDMCDLPSVEIPSDVNTAYPVWAMDRNGNLLVGDEANDWMTLEDYRKEQEF